MMDIKKSLISAALLAPLCTNIQAGDKTSALLGTAKLLAESDAKIILAINKDLSLSVINANTGEKIEPCAQTEDDKRLTKDEQIYKCYPKGHDPYGRIMKEASITLREGSYCYTAVLGNSLYVFCQPPLDLGF